MANIRVDLSIPIYDGQPVTFKSPADCSQVTGLVVYYPDGDTPTSKVFQFADAHGNNIGDLDLFAANAVVKVILDTDSNLAFVQNADTNAYLEGRFEDIEHKIENIPTPDVSGQINTHNEDTSAHPDIRNAMLPKSGGTMTGVLTLDSESSYLKTRTIELVPSVGTAHGGVIDFHFGGSEDDFTTRLIERALGELYLQGRLVVEGDIYERSSRVYSAVNKPTPADLGVPSVEEMNTALANKKGAEVYTATIGTNWTTDEATGVSYQSIAINGVTADHTAKVDHSNASVDGTSDGYATFVEEENQYLTCITNGYAETYDGGIKFTIFGDPNTISIPIVLEVV